MLVRVSGGDRAAFEMLYQRHAGWLTARLQSRCGDPDLTDIAVQDTFVAVWRSAKKFRGDGDVGAWIWGIGIRRLIDLLRRHRATPLDPSVIASMTGAGVDRASVPPSPDVEAIRAIPTSETDDLRSAMAALPADLCAVLVATAIDGLSTKEAAQLLGIPQGTVKTRLMRARQQLQEALT